MGKGEMGKELKRKNRRMSQTDKKPGQASGKLLCLLVKAAALMANSCGATEKARPVKGLPH